MTAIFPGSFNPFTIGHLDILSRALGMFDNVIVAIGYNEHKEFSSDVKDRLWNLRHLMHDVQGVRVELYSGLTIKAAEEFDAKVIIRGIRNAIDMEYERQMADTNFSISGIDTIFLLARPDFASVSSSMVRELANNGYNVDRWLPTHEQCLLECQNHQSR